MKMKAGLALAAAGALVLAGCSSNAEPGDDNPSSPSDLGALKVGIEAPWGLAYVPTSLAVAKMKDDGYDVEFVQFEDPSVMTAALDNGDIDISATSAAAVLAAADAGLDARAVLGLTDPDFVLVSQAGISSCEDLDGKRVGVQGQTDFILALTKTFIEENCPGTKPNYMELPGSENRTAALISDQLDASGIHLLRQKQLDQEYPGKFTTIKGFGAPKNVTSGWFYALAPWLEEHQEIVAAFATAYDDTIKEINADPQIAVDEAQRLVKDVDPKLLGEVARYWAENKLWPAKDGVSKKVFDATYKFYNGIQPFENKLKYKDVVWNRGY